MTAPRRRWFRFSLRTLFVLVGVLAIPLGWAGYQLHWIRQRHQWLDGSRLGFSPAPSIGPTRWNTRHEPPWPLRWFGEEASSGPLMGFGLSDEEFERVQALFPEVPLNNMPSTPDDDYVPDPDNPSA